MTRLTLVRPSLDDLPHAPGVPGFPFYTALSRDYAGIAGLLNVAFPDRAFCSESVRRSIVAPDFCFCTFVALDKDGEVAASASARRRFGMGEVAWVVTRSDVRRRGVATALVQHCLRYLKQSGFQEACAVLAPPTAESLSFWQALGFTEERGDLT